MPCRLLPTDRDGIPNVLVEAMAAGAPVVATAVSGIPELVEHEVNGLLIPPDDPEALADALLRLHDDPELTATAHPQRPRDGRRALRRRAARAASWPRCSPRRWSGERVDRDPAAPGVLRQRARAPRPRAGRGRRGRPLHLRRRNPRRSASSPTGCSADLPEDEEWRIDWVKFYYGLDLADAFRATGDRRFLDAWEKLVASFVLQVPPDHDSSDVTARRILNWIYAWQRLPEADVAGLAESIGEQARHVRANLTAERNHRTLELYALLIVALALPELGIAPPVAELHDNLLTDFGADGVHRERSTHYHLIALRSFVGARENCRRFGVALPAGFDERLTLACEFARDCRRPDGTIPALSDSDTGDYDELLALAGRLLEPRRPARRPGRTRTPTAATRSSAPATAT